MRSLSVFMNYTLTLISSLFWIHSNLNDVSCRMAGASRLHSGPEQHRFTLSLINYSPLFSELFKMVVYN